MATKYLVFRTESDSAEGWRDRKLQPSGRGTSILAEHFDSSDGPLPQPGDRLIEFHHVQEFADARFPQASTHYREGDWQVSRVESYAPGNADSDFKGIYICYCQYVPASSPLEPLEPVQEPDREYATTK